MIVKEFLESNTYYDVGFTTFLNSDVSDLLKLTSPIRKTTAIFIGNPSPGIIQIHNEEVTKTIRMHDPEFFNILPKAIEYIIDGQRRIDVRRYYA